MNKDKLEKVGILAKSEEQKSAHALKRGRDSHKKKCARLDQLVQFKEEYEARLTNLGEQGMEARQLQDYRLFLDRLNQAIDQQLKDVQVSEESLGVAREQWLSKSRRHLALNHLQEQQQRERQYQIEKAEQKLADEEALARRTLISKS